MKKDIIDFVTKCVHLQQMKYGHQQLGCMMHGMHIPRWKWEWITIDFMVGLPPIFEKFDTIWVIVHRLTILAYFVPIKVDYNVEKLAKIYLSEIV